MRQSSIFDWAADFFTGSESPEPISERGRLRLLVMSLARVRRSWNMAEASTAAVSPLVLVVDDDAAIRELASDVLARAGFRTLTATDGAEVLELAVAHQPGLIVL